MRHAMFIGLLTTALLRLTVPAEARHADNTPLVQSSADGAIYARCTPTEQDGNAGRTEIYQVRAEGDQLLDRYEYYATQNVVQWSPITGKVAILSVMRQSGADWQTQEELRFSLGGKLLKSHTSLDLVNLGAEEVVSKPGGHRAYFRVIGSEPVLEQSNEHDFVIEVGQGKRLRFDIVTGELRREANDGK